MADLKNSVIDLIGHTPLLRLDRFGRDLPARIAVKLESRNPLCSVKDRAAHSMIETAEQMGLIRPGTTVIEATSGNTGIALAFICASKDYPIIITMPANCSPEKHQMLVTLGARVHLTPGAEYMKGAIRKALEIQERLKDSYMPLQFENPANPKAHFETTGPEIWRETDGEVDIFAAGVGTGGTITGTGQYLKARKGGLHIAAVEPSGSPVLSGGTAGLHNIQGIGAGFIPRILDREVYDEVITVNDDEAAQACRQLARTEGLLAGISSGANLHAAKILALRPENKDKLIVTLICDTGERYFSTGLFPPPDASAIVPPVQNAKS